MKFAVTTIHRIFHYSPERNCPIGITEGLHFKCTCISQVNKKRPSSESASVPHELMTTSSKSSSKKRYDVTIQEGGLSVTSQFIFVKFIKIYITEIDVVLHGKLSILAIPRLNCIDLRE